jgi:hypothetical protein
VLFSASFRFLAAKISMAGADVCQKVSFKSSYENDASMVFSCLKH